MRAFHSRPILSLVGPALAFTASCDRPDHPWPPRDSGTPQDECPIELPRSGLPCRVPVERVCEYTLCPEPSYVAQCTPGEGWRVDEVPCYPSEPECPPQIPEPGSPCAGYVSTCSYYFEDCDGEPSTLAECPGGQGSWVVIDVNCTTQDAGS
jgi:hypothetical protein